jgi:hypothetical protein
MGGLPGAARQCSSPEQRSVDRCQRMFGNLFSARDVVRLCERLPQHTRTLARRLLWSGRRRTVDTYSRPAKDDAAMTMTMTMALAGSSIRSPSWCRRPRSAVS